MSCIIRR
ncbi:hypothetical protein CGLO_13122 [Colletotrichum gloeosporioides Cg-14]|nr:hypothetical protein CGLO_13122 [Colletotrichum gloeosporioides Cg-14]